MNVQGKRYRKINSSKLTSKVDFQRDIRVNRQGYPKGLSKY